MANCCICGKKIGGWGEDKFEIDKAHILCYQCAPLYRKAEDLSNPELSKSAISQLYERMEQCKTNTDVASYIKNLLSTIDVRAKEKIEEEQNQKEAMELALREFELKRKDFLLTTGYNFEKYEITKYLNLVHGEVVMGTGFLSELSASVNDFFGTTSGTFEGKLSLAKQKAQEQMIIKAMALGANALIGIDFDITTFANNMIGISGNATAVIIEKIS